MALQLDDNTVVRRSGGQWLLFCVHCGQDLGRAEENYYPRLALREGPASTAGPHIWNDASTYIDTAVVFRQYCCPGCFTAFHTEVVPVGHQVLLDKRLTPEALERHGGDS